jgi:hypothetical protein
MERRKEGRKEGNNRKVLHEANTLTFIIAVVIRKAECVCPHKIKVAAYSLWSCVLCYFRALSSAHCCPFFSLCVNHISIAVTKYLR